MKKPLYVQRGWQPIDIAFCPSIEAFKILKKSHNIEAEYPSLKGSVMARCIRYSDDKTGQSVIVVFMEKQERLNPIQTTGALIHEAVHVWQFIQDKIGIEKPDWETEAYAIQNIAEGLIQCHELTIGKHNAT